MERLKVWRESGAKGNRGIIGIGIGDQKGGGAIFSFERQTPEEMGFQGRRTDSIAGERALVGRVYTMEIALCNIENGAAAISGWKRGRLSPSTLNSYTL